MSHPQMQSAVAPKLNQFEYLRFLSILGVVIIHATAPYLVNLAVTENQVSPLVIFLVSLNQGARFSVPAFFFMSGFFMTYGWKDSFANPRELQAYIAKRLVRLLLPYLTWSFLLYITPSAVSGELKITSALVALSIGATFEGGYFIIALAQLSILGPMLYNRLRYKVFPYIVLIITGLL
jgi:peptidoglycan/LPS O-acetylase OafA/YrhL